MASSFTTNKDIEKPGNGDYVDTWNVPLNGDMTVVDYALGTTISFNATAGSQTLGSYNHTTKVLDTYSYIPLVINVTGAISASVTYTIPSGVGGQWTVRNLTTDSTGGPWSIIFASGGGGASAVIPRGVNVIIFCDGTNVYFANGVAGSNTQIQYNNSGTLGASANLTFTGSVLNINQPAGYGAGKVQASSGGNVFSAELPTGGPATGFISVGSSTVTNYDHFGAYKIGSGTRLFGVGSDGAITSAGTIIAGSTIKSSSGGFVFPDNTTQTTAATTPAQATTWYNTGNSFDTTYTNSSAFTITAFVSLVYSGYNGGFTVYVNGVGIATGGGNLNYKYGETITFPIPAGATFRIDSANCYAAQWAEFR